MKASLWAVAQEASAPGASLELEKEGVLATIISLAESCPVLTVKATAYYALGELSSPGVYIYVYYVPSHPHDPTPLTPSILKKGARGKKKEIPLALSNLPNPDIFLF